MIFSTNQATLISVFPPEKRGKVLGYLIGATYTGLTIGPVLGGVLNHTFGWRSIFALLFVAGILTFAFAVKGLGGASGAWQGQRENLDLLGSVLYVLVIVSMMYGLSSYSTNTFAKYLIILSIAWFALFLRHELRVESPVIQVRLFRRNISYTLSNLAALLNYGATFALGYLMSLYLQLIRGFDSQTAGIILISQPLIMALLSPYAGRLSDRISPYKLASFGMGLCALGLFLFIFISDDLHLALIVTYLAIMGLGFAFFSSPNTNAVMACVEPKDYGVASSLLATMRNLGQSSSMAIVTFIVATFLGNIPLEEADPAAVMHVMKVILIVFTILCTIGIFISLKRNRA